MTATKGEAQTMTDPTNTKPAPDAVTVALDWLEYMNGRAGLPDIWPEDYHHDGIAAARVQHAADRERAAANVWKLAKLEREHAATLEALEQCENMAHNNLLSTRQEDWVAALGWIELTLRAARAKVQ